MPKNHEAPIRCGVIDRMLLKDMGVDALGLKNTNLKIA
jgi:hypothetical protein